jgi:hypothetical protein
MRVMKGPKAMSKTATPTIQTLGKYEVSMEGIQTRLKVEKDITGADGKPTVRTFFVPLTKVTVALRNDRGGYVVYYMTQMGKRCSYSRTIGLPANKVINKEATGPEYITRGGSEPMKADAVHATISRMCGISMVEAAALFDTAGMDWQNEAAE